MSQAKLNAEAIANQLQARNYKDCINQQSMEINFIHLQPDCSPVAYVPAQSVIVRLYTISG